MSNEVTIKDNTDEVLRELDKAMERALVACGAEAESAAKLKLTENKAVDTGLLRNSITYALAGQEAHIKTYKADKLPRWERKKRRKKGEPEKEKQSGEYIGVAPGEVGEKAVYVGTNVEYAPYVEFGTGMYVPGGSKPWHYKDARGNWHYTKGMRARPYLKPAVTENADKFRKIIESELKKDI